MDVYDAPEAQIVTRLREAERERDEPRARVAELEAAPGGVAVAGLLRALAEEAREEAGGEAKFEVTKAERRGYLAALRWVTKEIKAHLAAPTPEQRAAAEVLALPLASAVPATVETIGDHAFVVCEAVADISGPIERKRACFVKAGRAVLAGIVACDAKPGGGT